MKNKKANLNMIVPAILVLTLGAIILIFGLIMLDSLQVETYKTTSVSVVNESVAKATTATSLTLSASTKRSVSCGTATKILNGTGSIVNIVIAGNFTQSGCVLTNATTMATWASNLSVTYPYTWEADTEASDSANQTIVGLGAFADYWDMIVLAIVISIVISLLLVVFSMRKQQ